MQLIASSREECTDHIRQKRLATTSKGPFESRKSTWATLASRAGFSEPFCLQPNMIYAIMGAMDMAGYRSSELYLDTARQVHIEAGRPWTQQLALAARQARRACQRGRGPAKQAQPLPLRDLSNLTIGKESIANGGPLWPVRAMLLASWWLLREIEASAARPTHVEIDEGNKLIHWRLPSSKCDWQALGHTNTRVQLRHDKRAIVSIPSHERPIEVSEGNRLRTPILRRGWVHKSRMGRHHSRASKEAGHRHPDTVGGKKIQWAFRKGNGCSLPCTNPGGAMENTTLREVGKQRISKIRQRSTAHSATPPFPRDQRPNFAPGRTRRASGAHC